MRLPFPEDEQMRGLGASIFDAYINLEEVFLPIIFRELSSFLKQGSGLYFAGIKHAL